MSPGCAATSDYLVAVLCSSRKSAVKGKLVPNIR
jgi:hypothetical protein